jgi:hypothetical protein
VAQKKYRRPRAVIPACRAIPGGFAASRRVHGGAFERHLRDGSCAGFDHLSRA